MKYKDVFEGLVAELNKTSKDTNFLATAKIQWGKSDERNKNGRLYSDLVVTPAIEKFNKEAQKTVGIVGNLDHPVGTSGTLLSNASHLISRVWKDEKKQWFADVKIMNTSKGRDLLAVLKTGSKIGASLRGVGEVDKNGNVKSGIEFRAIDFVSSPSFGASATVDQSSVVFESYVPNEENDEGWTKENIEGLTNVMDGLSDATVKMIQEKLEKSEGIIMTESRIQALLIWIKHQKSNPHILPFDEWFIAQAKKVGIQNSDFEEERNDNLRRQANSRSEKRMAFARDKTQLEKRQKELDEAISESRYDAITISRLYAEAALAGFKGSRADWIKEFGK